VPALPESSLPGPSGGMGMSFSPAERGVTNS
jgi:hypothetical protein